MNQIQTVSLVLIIVTIMLGYSYFDNYKTKKEYLNLNGKLTVSESLKSG
jgi:hypothetical protein